MMIWICSASQLFIILIIVLIKFFFKTKETKTNLVKKKKCKPSIFFKYKDLYFLIIAVNLEFR